MPDVATINTDNAPPAPTEFGAPLFARIVESMREGGRWVVLDLGQVQSATVELLSEFRCHLSIVDLEADLDAICACAQEDDLVQLKKQFAKILPDPRAGAEKANLVLGWDLLNYLPRPALAMLMRRVIARVQPDAWLHALITYSQPKMPARPGAFHPGRDDHLVYVPSTAQQCEAPRYTPKELERYMQGFQADQRRLLNNGMQEYLFRL